jgi:hypothetical protein
VLEADAALFVDEGLKATAELLLAFALQLPLLLNFFTSALPPNSTSCSTGGDESEMFLLASTSV